VNAVRVDDGEVLYVISWNAAALTAVTEMNADAKRLEGDIVEIGTGPELKRSSAIGMDR
jgi:hypothetical protein